MHTKGGFLFVRFPTSFLIGTPDTVVTSLSLKSRTMVVLRHMQSWFCEPQNHLRGLSVSKGSVD